MNLKIKRELAAKVLKCGKNRLWFNPESLSEIKEAITKQDIESLYNEGIIKIKPIRGRKTIVRRNRKKGPGKIKMTIKKRKEIYVKITRKLRRYLFSLRIQNKISKEDYLSLRKKIKMRAFKNMAYFKEYIASIEKKETIKKIKSKENRK